MGLLRDKWPLPSARERQSPPRSSRRWRWTHAETPGPCSRPCGTQSGSGDHAGSGPLRRPGASRPAGPRAAVGRGGGAAGPSRLARCCAGLDRGCRPALASPRTPSARPGVCPPRPVAFSAQASRDGISHILPTKASTLPEDSNWPKVTRLN
ncbi:translation initiation factor IF-2-like [Ailuropoda melanoleuca]|uniref:translation initiation factor IF-2-like n=1 Tax=Ailuropoda melanoleuca TaxID=9646 RepID=UPI0014949E1E|nr:translation initiation factor IF-2-like [Ailuropoda melanoleuca]